MLNKTMHRGAVFSEQRTWRYSLWRHWDDSSPKLVAVLLNPSWADSVRDDPTTTFMVNWAIRNGYGEYTAVNLFALIGTDPTSLLEHEDPVGADNDRYIELAVGDADTVLVAWGSMSFAPRGSGLHFRPWAVRRMLAVFSPICFGLTKSHAPRFPRALRRDVGTRPFLC
ncbi:MAG: DUF1643 domain-containing protein [Nitrospiraceae bacterium]